MERRNYFSEIFEGTGIRVAAVIDDLESTIGKEVSRFLAEVNGGIDLNRKTKTTIFR